MPPPPTVLHGELREIKWDKKQQATEINKAKTVQVQFNPESLKVNFSNQNSGGDQRGGSAKQFIGAGTTKLSFELWFDVTGPLPEKLPEGVDANVDDVRRLTEKVAYFIKPKPTRKKNKFLPPGVRFIWGTFMYDGIIDSIDENLEFFSEEGKPLRASISINMSRQEIQFQFGDQSAPGTGSGGSPGGRTQVPIKDRETLQKAAAANDRQEDWQNIAAANGIEDPRNIAPGTLIDFEARVSGGLNVGVGLGIGVNVGLDIGASAGTRIGASASGRFGAGAGPGNSLQGGGGAELGFGS